MRFFFPLPRLAFVLAFTRTSSSATVVWGIDYLKQWCDIVVAVAVAVTVAVDVDVAVALAAVDDGGRWDAVLGGDVIQLVSPLFHPEKQSVAPGDTSVVISGSTVVIALSVDVVVSGNERYGWVIGVLKDLVSSCWWR